MPDLNRSDEERDLLREAARVLPGGSLGNLRLDEDYAFIVREGRGSRIWDVSGNEYVDYLLGSGPMVLGHAHPAVVEAVGEALKKGTTFFTQNAYAVELAKRIVDAMPCAGQVRFVSSGTEATYHCLRLARAFAGRDKVLKFEGGYHGMHDYSLMSLAPSGTTPFPTPEPTSAGIPRAVQDTVLVAPFNDLAATADIIEGHHDELAAVIVEPVQRVLPPVPGFLDGLRELTGRYGILLVFDEVVTGFRMAYGGAQEYYGVVPDLAAVGKIAGGGFPLAAVVGRADVMATYDASGAGPASFVPAVGTLSGNPISAAAGIATLEVLSQPGTYDRLWTTGQLLRSRLQQMLDEAEVPAVVSGMDPFFDVYFTEQPVVDYRSTLQANPAMNKAFDRALLEHGVFKGPSKFYIGLCHGAEEVERTIAAFKAAVAAVRG